MELVIEKASTADYTAAWQIFHSVVKEGDTYVYDPDTSRGAFEDLWFTQPLGSYVAKLGGEVVGIYVLRKNRMGLAGHIANAGYMTHPKHQGKGIAKAMCKHSLEEAKKLGFKAMQFNFVVSTNTRAVKLWEFMGFKIVGTVPEAYQHQKLDKLVDVHTMWRQL